MEKNADAKYDDLFLEILQEKKTIVDFLKTVFSFLARRTDFYHEAKSESDGFGFLPGIKEKVVHDVMLQCDPKCMQIYSPKLGQGQPVPPDVVAEEVTIETTFDEPEPPKKPLPSNPAPLRHAPRFQANEYYNGAQYENYSWSQTISELELYVLLPEHISSAKQLAIKINPDFISIGDKLTPNVKILEGKLAKKCRSSEAVWSVSNRKLQITLDKTIETWWEQFLVTEPELDSSKMDCSRPLDELPEESQVAIEKLRWDQQQKMLGRPTSDEVRNEELLRRAWDAEGSPFKGQPFDPSLVKF